MQCIIYEKGKDNMSEEQELSFEEAIKQLEDIVLKLEEGDVPLEEALAFFQRGMTLSKICHDKLAHVEKQMAQMLQENGDWKPLQIQEDES